MPANYLYLTACLRVTFLKVPAEGHLQTIKCTGSTCELGKTHLTLYNSVDTVHSQNISNGTFLAIAHSSDMIQSLDRITAYTEVVNFGFFTENKGSRAISIPRPSSKPKNSVTAHYVCRSSAKITHDYSWIPQGGGCLHHITV